MSTLKHLCLSSAMAILAAAPNASLADKNSDVADRAIDASTSFILQGKGAEAIQSLLAAPLSAFDEKDKQYRTCVIRRLGGHSPEPLSTDGNDGFVKSLLQIYRSYWLDSLASRASKASLEARLRNRLRNLLGPDARHAVSMEQIEGRLKEILEKRGYFVQLGTTLPFSDLLLWRTQEKRTYDVALPEGKHAVQVVLMSDFISRGWSSYARCERGSAGGWATARELFAVVPAYDKDGGLDSETFRVVFLGHETQHLVDQNRFRNMQSWELEYRAKLVELAMSDGISRKRLRSFVTAQGMDPQAPHTYANHVLVRELIKKASVSLESLPTPTLRHIATELLTEDTRRRLESPN